jgi:cell division septation protein DedD
MADDPDGALRMPRIGSVDPMDELDDFEKEVVTNRDLDNDEDQVRFEGHDRDEAPRSRWLPIVTAVFALLGFAGIVWYAYHWGAGSVPPEELPVIRAQEEPSKIKPESPGGLEVPYQETQALNQIQPDPEKPQVERLLPPPETPLVPPTEAPSTAVETAAAAPETPAPETSAAQEPIEVAPVPVPAVPSTAEAATPAPSVPAAPKAAPTQTASATSGDYVIQLASLTAKDRATAEWARLQKGFPTLLGDRQLVVVTADLGSRGTFFRVQAGFFPDRASADAACAQLKARGQDCLVTKR